MPSLILAFAVCATFWWRDHRLTQIRAEVTQDGFWWIDQDRLVPWEQMGLGYIRFLGWKTPQLLDDRGHPLPLGHSGWGRVLLRMRLGQLTPPYSGSESGQLGSKVVVSILLFGAIAGLAWHRSFELALASSLCMAGVMRALAITAFALGDVLRDNEHNWQSVEDRCIHWPLGTMKFVVFRGESVTLVRTQEGFTIQTETGYSEVVPLDWRAPMSRHRTVRIASSSVPGDGGDRSSTL